MGKFCFAQTHIVLHFLPCSLPPRYDLPQYGSRRKLLSPSGLYDEYGEVVVDDDGSYYYSPQESDGEVNRKLEKPQKYLRYQQRQENRYEEKLMTMIFSQFFDRQNRNVQGPYTNFFWSPQWF